MKQVAWLFLLIILVSNVQAQINNGKISGVVRNADDKVVEGATVSLLKASDSSIVKIAVANGDGNFEIEKLNVGSYLLSISAVGFTSFTTPPLNLNTEKPALIVNAIRLQPDGASLGAVTIISRRPLIEQRPDRTIVNVDAAVTNVGATALEVLEKSPGVSVDRDGNISLKGKQGVLVMLDGKPSYLSNADLASMLAGMSANQLDQIEIMTNPPAKYDAAGNSGIINIKTKKNKQKGFNGNLSLNYGQGRYWKTNNSLNLNYKNNKFNIFLNYSMNANKGFSNLHINRTYYGADRKTITSFFEQPTNMVMSGSNNTLKVGMDYSISKKTTVGIVATGFISPRHFDGTSTGYLKDASGNVDSIADTKSNNNNRWKNGTANLNMRHQFNATDELTADIDYIQYNSSNTQLFNNSIYYPDGTIVADDQLRGDLPSDIKIYSGKMDYSKTFKKGLKMDAGFKSSLVKTDNIADYYNFIGSDWKPDYDITNHFLYEENINAVYLNMNKQVNKWSFQAGLRYENTNYKGHQLGNMQRDDSAFNRRYNSLFPTAYLSYNADSSNTFTLSAGRRIDRPAYRQLNPFVFFINKFTYQVGNPFMLPQYTSNIEFSHTYKGFLTTTLSYSDTKESFSQIFFPDGAVTIVTEGNLGRIKNLGLSVSAQLNPTKWWSSSLQATLNYREVDGFASGDVVKSGAPNAQASINNQFRFNKGWAAELSGFYNGKNIEGQFTIEAFGQVSAGISKQILKDKGSIKLNIRDMFYTQIIKGGIKFGNVQEHFVQSRDSRVVNIAFTYRFGKAIKESGRRNTGGARDEQNRVGAN